MAGRPPIDLNQKVRDLLTHTVQFSPKVDAPIRIFEERANACLGLIKYIDDHLTTQSLYRACLDRHMTLLHRMVLVSLVEAFERFMKELAVACVDFIAPFVIDDRFEKFTISGGSLAAQFDVGSIGKALCESDTWLSNSGIDERFRQLLKPHFGKPWEEFLFPNQTQRPDTERERARTLSILWQVRHNITHNTGLLTEADAKRFVLMVEAEVESGGMLNPTADDLRYVKRFLVETAINTNRRVGERLADLLTERHRDAPALLDPQANVNSLVERFQVPLTIDGVTPPA